MTHFKNYTEQHIELSSGFNLLYGSNGSGKTNVLDAIHYLALAKSHFVPQDRMAILHGSDFFRIEGHFKTDTALNEKVVLKYQLKNKRLEWNDKQVERIVDHIGRIGLVMIAPDDLEVIDGVSGIRRRFMDVTLVQTDAEYLHQLSIYRKLLDQRNAYLKQHVHPDPVLLQVLNEKMNEPARYLYQARHAFIEEYSPYFLKYYKAISGSQEAVALQYESDLKENDLSQLFSKCYDHDIRIRYTSKGSHKDELIMTINNHEVKYHASQGQKKTFLVSLFLAQAEFMTRVMPSPPIVLLDDIFDKLDPLRMRYLMQLLWNMSLPQIIMTDTSQERIKTILNEMGSTGNYIYVENGTIQSIK